MSSQAFANAGIACEQWCLYIERHPAPLCVLLTHVCKPAFKLLFDLTGLQRMIGYSTGGLVSRASLYRLVHKLALFLLYCRDRRRLLRVSHQLRSYPSSKARPCHQAILPMVAFSHRAWGRKLLVNCPVSLLLQRLVADLCFYI